MITVVGLGYDKDCVSVKGLKAIESADKLFVLTEKTAAGAALKQYNPVYMDDLFESAADFDALQTAIVARLSDGCVYATDGTGYSDGAVKLLTAAGKATVIPGSVESADCALVLTATDAATALSYLDTAAWSSPNWTTRFWPANSNSSCRNFIPTISFVCSVRRIRRSRFANWIGSPYTTRRRRSCFPRRPRSIRKRPVSATFAA